MGFTRTLILLFLLVSALAVWDMAGGGVGGFAGMVEHDFVRFGGQRERVPLREPDFEEQHSLGSLAGVRRVVIDGFSGNLEVTRSATDELSASYSVAIWTEDRGARTADTAAALARQLTVEWAREGEEVRLQVERPQPLPPGIQALRVLVRLAVPDGVQVEARHAGSARIVGIAGSVRLDHSRGEVEVREVQGPVNIASSWTSVRVESVRGPVQVDVTGGEMRARDIAGSVGGSVRMGALQLRGVEGDVTFSVDQGAGRVEDVGGDVRVTGSFGEMIVAQVAGDVEAYRTFGALKVRGVTRAADLSVRFGDMEVVLQGEGGWTVDAVAELGALETSLNLQREQSDQRVALSGVIGDGAHPLRVRVEQGSARIARR